MKPHHARLAKIPLKDWETKPYREIAAMAGASTSAAYRYAQANLTMQRAIRANSRSRLHKLTDEEWRMNTTAQLAEAFGFSANRVVREFQKRHNKPTHPWEPATHLCGPRSPLRGFTQWGEFTVKEIAEISGCKLYTVYMYMRRHGVRPKPDKRGPKS